MKINTIISLEENEIVTIKDTIQKGSMTLSMRAVDITEFIENKINEAFQMGIDFQKKEIK